MIWNQVAQKFILPLAVAQVALNWEGANQPTTQQDQQSGTDDEGQCCFQVIEKISFFFGDSSRNKIQLRDNSRFRVGQDSLS